jgi:hypothetical protein
MVSKFSFLTGIAVAFAAIVNARSFKTGSTVNLDGTSYYVPASAVATLKISSQKLKAASTSGEDLIPLTVFKDTVSSFSASVLATAVASYTANDDVFSPGFLQGKFVVLKSSENSFIIL